MDIIYHQVPLLSINRWLRLAWVKGTFTARSRSVLHHPVTLRYNSDTENDKLNFRRPTRSWYLFFRILVSADARVWPLIDLWGSDLLLGRPQKSTGMNSGRERIRCKFYRVNAQIRAKQDLLFTCQIIALLACVVLIRYGKKFNYIYRSLTTTICYSSRLSRRSVLQRYI